MSVREIAEAVRAVVGDVEIRPRARARRATSPARR